MPNHNLLTPTLLEGSKWVATSAPACGRDRQSPLGKIHEFAKARVNGDVQPCS